MGRKRDPNDCKQWGDDHRDRPRESAMGYNADTTMMRLIAGCRALWLEVIRRAAYDWVLYRTSTRIQQKEYASSAYSWLFEERPGTPLWEKRRKEQEPGVMSTSFHAVCEFLDLDPEAVLRRIRLLTPKDVLSIGRPVTKRRLDVGADHNEDCLPDPYSACRYREAAIE
jgi:hypothetical protein